MENGFKGRVYNKAWKCGLRDTQRDFGIRLEFMNLNMDNECFLGKIGFLARI